MLKLAEYHVSVHLITIAARNVLLKIHTKKFTVSIIFFSLVDCIEICQFGYIGQRRSKMASTSGKAITGMPLAQGKRLKLASIDDIQFSDGYVPITVLRVNVEPAVSYLYNYYIWNNNTYVYYLYDDFN